MSEKSIWNSLRSGGISEAGTAAIMGNFYCESLLIPNNVENRCPLSDEDYTYNVDHGIISEDQWSTDAYGYGLYQLTYHTRKRGYIRYAKSKGVSIADEAAQCEYCLKELNVEYSDLLSYLKTTTDVYTATSRFCKEFERPAYNNVQDRYNAAQRYYDKLRGTEVSLESLETASTVYVPKTETTESCEITVRKIRMGDTGTDVAMLQTGLNRHSYNCGNADGIFGSKTQNAVTAFQTDCNLTPTGIADSDVWQILFQ